MYVFYLLSNAFVAYISIFLMLHCLYLLKYTHVVFSRPAAARKTCEDHLRQAGESLINWLYPQSSNAMQTPPPPPQNADDRLPYFTGSMADTQLTEDYTADNVDFTYLVCIFASGP